MNNLLGQTNKFESVKRWISLRVDFAPIVVVVLYALFFLLFRFWTTPFYLSNKGFEGVHSAILSVGAIFAGFLFTALGILISILDRRSLKLFMRSSIKSLKDWMLWGTASSVMSALFGLIAMLNSSQSWQIVIVFLELAFVILSMTLFILASYMLRNVFEEIWNEEELPRTESCSDHLNIEFPEED